MIKRLTYLLSSLVVSTLLTSCSIDRLEAINFPESAKTGETISVTMVNAYTYLSFSREVMDGFAAQRDNVHLMIRVPDGYEVTSVKSVVIRDLDINSIFGKFNDPGTLAPLVLQYMSQLTAMSRDANLDSQFKGLTFEAHSAKDRNNSVQVSTDQGSWTGYSAPFGVSLKAGDMLDTVVVIDSLLSLAEQMGVDASSINLDSIIQEQGIPIQLDSIAFTTVPALIQVTLKTKNTIGKDTIYFYSTTASEFPTSTDIQDESTIDLGSMLFAELNVSDGSSIKSPSVKTESSTFRLSKNAGNCKIFYKLNNTEFSPSVSIYSPLGILVRTIQLTSDGYGNWDYTDKNGGRVSAGRYFAAVNKSHGSNVLPIDVIR